MNTLVEQALRSGEWSLVLLAIDDLLAQRTSNMRWVTRHINQVARSLTMVEPQEDIPAQAARLADWLIMSTDQAALVAESGGERLIWRTRKDDAVREVHRGLEGTAVEAGQPFQVGSVQMFYPGQPVGDPSLWYNCRCQLERESLAAALTPDADTHDGAAIVLVPADGDPIHEVGPESKHMTLMFLPEGLDESAEEAIAAYARALSGPITIPVTGMDLLGEQAEAQVALLDPEVPSQIRDGLLLAAAEVGLQDGSTWPTYTPHVTLGYDDGSGPEDLSLPESVTFDKLAVWTDAGQVGWDLGDVEPPQEEPVAEIEPEEPADEEDEEPILQPLMFHGIAVIEGVETDADDGMIRLFSPGALEWRTPPFTLTFEHIADGMRTEVLGAVQRVWRLEENRDAIAYEGTFDDTAEADTRIGQIANGSLGKVSVHVGGSRGTAMQGAEGEPTRVTIDAGKIAGLAVVPMPGLEHAYIALGPWPPVVATVATAEEDPVEELVAAVSDKPWDGSAGRFTPEQWKRSCILHVCDGEEKSCHKLPIREPGGALSRAGVHAAAARINQVDATPEQISTAKGHLRSAYKELGEEPPEVVAAAEPFVLEMHFEGWPASLVSSLGDFKRGPGWVTNPEDTRRLHRYWTQPGQPGYAKIGWGTPSDFYRCRMHLAEYINPLYLNRVCAEWHHDALGIWPGEHSAGGTMVASVLPETYTPPATWFTDPALPFKTPLTISRDGHIFGHLAAWDQCHISYGELAGRCVLAPHSPTNYAWFRLGRVLTDAGEVNVGQIVLGGGHARDGITASHAQDHYASTSRAVADIAVGEDNYGIWFSGAVRPGITSDDLYALRAAKLSGDWRTIHGQLELVAALAVNVPGLPVPEMSLVASADGDVLSLTAAGVVIDSDITPEEHETATAASALVQATTNEMVVAAIKRIKAADAAKQQFRARRLARARSTMGAR